LKKKNLESILLSYLVVMFNIVQIVKDVIQKTGALIAANVLPGGSVNLSKSQIFA
jgi:hypothetical protein